MKASVTPVNKGSVPNSPNYAVIFVLVLLAAAGFIIGPKLPELLHIEPNENKKLLTLDEFYPFYLTQHSNLTSRKLHVIGTSLTVLLSFFNPYLFPAALVAGGIGYGLFYLFLALPHGFIDFACMILSLLVFIKACGGNMREGLKIVAIAYLFAWIGHFFFEKNVPATFTYPAFSLMSDFRMLYDSAIRRSIPI